jgi:hypothetical protein
VLRRALVMLAISSMGTEHFATANHEDPFVAFALVVVGQISLEVPSVLLIRYEFDFIAASGGPFVDSLRCHPDRIKHAPRRAEAPRTEARGASGCNRPRGSGSSRWVSSACSERRPQARASPRRRG